tara:strand:+ start:113 stop:355 length:243 start_codon:yes stop_codon:yes gene_type:complete
MNVQEDERKLPMRKVKTLMDNKQKASWDEEMKKIILTKKDYFRSGMGKEHEKYMKKTILNNEKACLKKCDMLLKKMQEAG